MALCVVANPVAVRHPLTGQFVTLSKGVELDDSDPLVKHFGWAFEPVKGSKGRQRADSVPPETRDA